MFHLQGQHIPDLSSILRLVQLYVLQKSYLVLHMLTAYGDDTAVNKPHLFSETIYPKVLVPEE